MKANELRIGNLIHVDNHIAKVVSINELGITPSIIERASQCNNSGSKSPIPLTEEWLIRFGFEPTYFETGSKSYYRINGYDFISESNELIWFKTKIKHVHQLQNIYFALTGEELKLKEQ